MMTPFKFEECNLLQQSVTAIVTFSVAAWLHLPAITHQAQMQPEPHLTVVMYWV
jgi:hypothetical protein